LVMVGIGEGSGVAGMRMVAVDVDGVLWWSGFLVFPPSNSVVMGVGGGCSWWWLMEGCVEEWLVVVNVGGELVGLFGRFYSSSPPRRMRRPPGVQLLVGQQWCLPLVM
jgi:hypothetical protein